MIIGIDGLHLPCTIFSEVLEVITTFSSFSKTHFLPIFWAHSGILSPRVTKNSRSFGGKSLKYLSRSPQVYL